MKTQAQRWIVAILLIGGIASGVGCYPVQPLPNQDSAFIDGGKGYAVPPDNYPQQPQPVRYAVDPAVAIAGVAAAGLLGYAIANNHGHHHPHYYGHGYYRPVPYYRGGYYRRYYR